MSQTAVKFSVSFNSHLLLLCALSGKFFWIREKELENVASFDTSTYFLLKWVLENRAGVFFVWLTGLQERARKNRLNILLFYLPSSHCYEKIRRNKTGSQPPTCFQTTRETVFLSKNACKTFLFFLLVPYIHFPPYLEIRSVIRSFFFLFCSEKEGKEAAPSCRAEISPSFQQKQVNGQHR